MLGAAVHQVFETKSSGTPLLLFGVSHGDLRSRRMQPCEDQSDFSVQKHLPFWCEKALYSTNGVPLLGEAGWELMQILLSQLLVYPFLKALAGLHKQNCPHKDRKLSNRGIALLLQANVTAILNYNFKTQAQEIVSVTTPCIAIVHKDSYSLGQYFKIIIRLV